MSKIVKFLKVLRIKKNIYLLCITFLKICENTLVKIYF